MRFLVQMELVEWARPSGRPRNVLADRPMGTALDACARLERQGRIVAGGLCAGAATLTFIAEARSCDELGSVLEELPSSSQMRIGVTALDPFSDVAPRRRARRARGGSKAGRRVRQRTSGGAKSRAGSSTLPTPRLTNSGPPASSNRPKG